MNKENYTSLELSKKLKENGCKLLPNKYYSPHIHKEKLIDVLNKKPYDFYILQCLVPAYDTLNDLCVKYAKEMFGEFKNEDVKCSCGLKKTNVINWGYRIKGGKILEMLQEGKKQEAEDYIFEHCLFNPKNK